MKGLTYTNYYSKYSKYKCRRQASCEILDCIGALKDLLLCGIVDKTLRHILGNLISPSLSFSSSNMIHDLRLHLFCLLAMFLLPTIAKLPPLELLHSVPLHFISVSCFRSPWRDAPRAGFTCQRLHSREELGPLTSAVPSNSCGSLSYPECFSVTKNFLEMYSHN